MDLNKKIKHFKLLTTTAAFRDRITNSESACSALHSRLVYSWLAFRSIHNLGASARSMSSEVGLHPKTVSSAVNSLGDLVERRGQEWVALEPQANFFITRKAGKEAKHWSDHLAYSILYLPKKGAKIVYPEASFRFGINHALIWSHLVRSAEKHGGVVRRFTMKGAATLFDIDPKTVRSIISDLVWLKLIQRVDLGGCSEITALPLSADHLKMFEPKPEVDHKVVEPTARSPRSTVTGFTLKGDHWDECRRTCEGMMTQAKAEEMIADSRRLGEGSDGFLSEFKRVKSIFDTGVVSGKIAAGTFGAYLAACYGRRIAVLEEQEREEQRERRLSSPEFQEWLAQKRKDAKADPKSASFSLSDDAILDRIAIEGSPVEQWRNLEKVKSSLHRAIKSHVVGKRLPLQAEIDEIGNLKGRILRQALAALNHFYQQPVKATQGQFEEAIDEAIRKVEPSMQPIFAQPV